MKYTNKAMNDPEFVSFMSYDSYQRIVKDGGKPDVERIQKFVMFD
jgi:hypothetical protein